MRLLLVFAAVLGSYIIVIGGNRVVISLLCGVVISYFLSYVLNIREYHSRNVSLFKAISKCWPQLLLSAAMRFGSIAAILGATAPLIASSSSWHAHALHGAFVGLSAIAFPHALFAFVRSSAVSTVKFNAIQYRLIALEKHLWFGFVDALAHEEANLLAAIWAEFYPRKWVLLSVFEEERPTIVRFYYRHRNKYPGDAWYYYGMQLVGDTNTKRVEGLVYTHGANWTIKRLRSVADGSESVRYKVVTDKRHPCDERDPQKLLHHRRECAKLIGSLIMENKPSRRSASRGSAQATSK